MHVERLMTRNPATVVPYDSLRLPVALMQAGRFRRLPVVADHQLVGIVTETDVSHHFIELTECRAVE